METAEEEFRLKPRLIELTSPAEAQNSPSPFGMFALLYNGNLISYHPISNTRFRNIMSKLIS